MGGSSSQTIGYKYYLGVHMALCHGPIDFISRIDVDKKTAWEGVNEGGELEVDAGDLFGGKKREGGVSGLVDIDLGDATQLPNAYLTDTLGEGIPAYRGVTAAILKQCYMGNTPYIKPWAFWAQRIFSSTDGAQQWYRSKAPIGQLGDGDHAVYIGLDISGSMSTNDRLSMAQTALDGFFDYVDQFTGIRSFDFRVNGWNTTVNYTTERGVDSAAIQRLKDHYGAFTPTGDTDFTDGVSPASSFFSESASSKKRTLIFITDGEPSPAGSPSEAEQIENAQDAADIVEGIDDVFAWGININLADTRYTEYIDNTESDGVPVIEDGDSEALENTLKLAISGHLDMNPAHIIRECLTDTNWGLGYSPADIDDTAFMEAADTLFNESMGISLMWDREMPIEEFVMEILRHIDAAIYVSRSTGKFVLKLIRDDFSDGSNLITLDESNVRSVSNPRRPTVGELISSVTVQFWDYTVGENASVTVHDQALIQGQGVVNSTTVQYPGFTVRDLAARVANRDLRTLSTPLLSCDIEADRTAAELNLGDAFILDWPDLEINTLVMRVQQITYGDGIDNTIRITCVEDAFSLPGALSGGVLAPESGLWVDPANNTALDASPVIVMEQPYYVVAREVGDAAIGTILADDADAGFLFAAAGRQNNEVNAQLHVDSGSGYIETGTLDFSPHCYLSGGISKTSTTFYCTGGVDLEDLEPGALFQINDEILRYDSSTTDSNGHYITCGRGCLDTVPAVHANGDAILFWGNYVSSDEVQYTTSESLDVKIRTVTPSDVLAEASATTHEATMSSRAARPYPPGDLRVDGSSYDVVDPYGESSGGHTLTWVHRDRLQQTGGTVYDHYDAGIGPEAGTTYRVDVWSTLSDDTETSIWQTQSGITGTSWTQPDSYLPSEAADSVAVNFKVTAIRDGYESWQSPVITLPLVAPGGNAVLEDGNNLVLEDGNNFVMES